jgi:O-antigen ligase
LPYLLLILVALAVAGTQLLAGGRELVLCLPGYGLLAVAALLSWWPARRTPIPRAVGECIASAAIFFAFVVTRALFSPEEYLARKDLYLALGAWSLYLLVALNLTSAKLRGILVAALLGLAVTNCFIAAIQFGKDPSFMVFDFLSRPDYGPRASGFYGYPNHLAVFLEISLMMGLGVAFWSRWRPWVKILAGYCAFVCVIGILLTGSRGGFIGCIAGLVIFGFLCLHLTGKLDGSRAIALVVAGCLAVGVLGLGVQHFLSKSAVLQSRVDQKVTVNDARLQIWKAAWSQFKQSPVVGTGSGTHLYYGRQFRHPSVQLDAVHAHNEYLEVLAEYGILGLVAALMFLDTHLRSGWRTFRSRMSRHSSSLDMGSNSLALTIGALSATTACLVHSLVDFTLHMPANMLAMAFIFGMLANPGNTVNSEEDSGLPAWLRLGLPVLGLCALFGALPTWPAEYYAAKARAAFTDPQFIGSPETVQVAETQARLGLAWDKRNPELYFYIGGALREQALKANDPAAKKAFWEKSLEAYQRALDLAPQDVLLVLVTGAALDALGRFDESAPLFARALQLDPKSIIVLTDYATHLHAQGRLLEAAEQYRQALQLGAGYAAQMGLDRVTGELGPSLKSEAKKP